MVNISSEYNSFTRETLYKIGNYHRIMDEWLEMDKCGK